MIPTGTCAIAAAKNEVIVKQALFKSQGSL